MLLGKRPRPPMKRTTSMTGITTVDYHEHQSPQQEQPFDRLQINNPTEEVVVAGVADYDNHHLHHHHIHDQEYYNSNQYFMSMISPRPIPSRGQRRNSEDFLETAHFLRTCGLCNRRLVSGRDIYMYMGDTAFCSLECREKQMKKDEKKNCTTKKIGETSSSSSKTVATA